MIKSRPPTSYLYTLARPFNKAGAETGGRAGGETGGRSGGAAGDPGGGARPTAGAARDP